MTSDQTTTETTTTGDDAQFDAAVAATRPNVFFRLATVMSGVFVITILGTVATIFGDSEAPATQFIQQYGGLLMAMEAAVAVTLGAMAIASDRKEIRRRAADGTRREQSEDRHE